MRARLVAIVLLAVVLLGGALAVCVVFGPGWLVGSGSGLTAAERLKAQNDVRATLLRALGGLLALGGVGLGAALTLRQLRINRDDQHIALFATAVKQLAGDRVSERMAGMYTLEQLATVSARFRGHIHALVTAFIRQHAPWPPVRPEDELARDRARLQGGLPDDIGAAFALLHRRAMIEGENPSLLEHVDLREVNLEGLNLTRAIFAYANLSGARLAGATLLGADLRGADLTGADLTGVITDDETKWPEGFQP
jgi:hypothetical protein